MNLKIQGTHLDLDDELRSYVEEKLQDAFRAFGDTDLEPVDVAVELERTTRRHPHEREDERRYRAEANVTVPGRLIRAEASADTLRQAIVRMKHTLTREIREWRAHLADDQRRGAREATDLSAESEGEGGL